MTTFELNGKTFKVVADDGILYPCGTCAFQMDSTRCRAVRPVTGHDCIMEEHHYVEVTDENA